jgi:hypothetical protein
MTSSSDSRGTSSQHDSLTLPFDVIGDSIAFRLPSDPKTSNPFTRTMPPRPRAATTRGKTIFFTTTS